MVEEVSESLARSVISVEQSGDFRDWLDAYVEDAGSVSIEDGVALAKVRRAWMVELIERDPRRALAEAISLEVREGLPEEVVELLEVPISAGGEFEMVVTCHFGDGAESELARYLTIGGERFRAFTFGRRAEMQTKDWISVHGIAVGDALAFYPDPVRRIGGGAVVVAEAFGERMNFASEDELEFYVARLVDSENSAGPGDGEGGGLTAKSAHTEGAKRILYFRVRFADEDPDYTPLNLEDAQRRQGRVGRHFAAASYGKISITTVYPDMITLAENKSEYVGQALGKMMNEARATAITMGQAAGEDWDYSNYDFYTIVSSGGIGGYAGVAQVGGRKSHLQGGGSAGLRTAGHEFGHNFGLGHAYFNWASDLNPRGSTPTDGLTRVEYGHRFSLMSAQSGSDMDNEAIPHFTVHEKWRLDWLTDDDFVDVRTAGQSGTYRVFQNDLADATGLRALRVPSGGDLSRYWLSYRTAWSVPNRSSDNDYLLNGILFNWTGSGGGTSTLLDMTPYSDQGSTGGAEWTRDNSDKWDAPLLIGRTYTDSETGLSVTPVERGGAAPDEYIDVYVHLAVGEEVEVVGETDACRAVVPDVGTAADWTARAFDDSAWPFSGAGGVGYDENADYEPFIGTDVESVMNNENPSCYIRIPFELTEVAGIEGLKLLMRYDDGFVAYINGVKVAEENAPDSLFWNSEAERLNDDDDAVEFEEFSADAGLGALVVGTNVLAIHGLNDSDGSSDFLIQPKLLAVLAPPANTPPVVSLEADTLVAAVGQGVAFTASGSDPDGDDLAFAWDYDIGDEFAPEGLNSATAVRSWDEAGLYAVTLTCSDMKGGITRERLLVKVGAPEDVGMVRGRVLRGGVPVDGARVFVDGTDIQSVTLDDGSYVIAGLDVGDEVTVGAMLDGEVFLSAVAMPVVPGEGIDGVDFLGHGSLLAEVPAQVLSISPHVASAELGVGLALSAGIWDNTVAEDLLVPFGDTWSYLETGVDPGNAWMEISFDDSGWLSGAAELGYGDDQVTEIGFGGDPDAKHITAWFRRSFAVADAAGVSRLKLSVERDDGVRVFLNGVEIARDNITSGTIGVATESRNEVSGSAESALIHFNVDPGLLVDGVNVVAAEVHQEDEDSSDLSFDLQLSAARNLSVVTPVWSVVPGGASVSAGGIFSATEPGVYTVTASLGGLSDEATVRVASDNLVSVAVDDGFLWENGAANATVRVSREGSTAEALPVGLSGGGEATDRDDFSGLPGEVVIPAGADFVEFEIAVVDDSLVEGREWVRISLQAGELYGLGAAAIASIAIVDDEVVGELAVDAGEDAVIAVGEGLELAGSLLAEDGLVSGNDYWKYDDGGVDLGTGWRVIGFSDVDWKEGDGQFGYGDGDERTEIGFGGNSSNRQITTYFRRRFYLDDAGVYSGVVARLLVDDGAVVYLNGAEVLRVNLPSGLIGATTRADNAIGGDDEDTYFDYVLDPGDLLDGENLIAVEVHQASSTSSDVGFDLQLDGIRDGGAPVWTKVSGPGAVLFADETDPMTTVSFDQPGEYELALSGEGGVSDVVTVTVDGVAFGYAAWVAGFGLADESAGADADGDGFSNLLEFAAVTHPGEAGSSAVPALERGAGAPGTWEFSYRRRVGDGAGVTGDGYSVVGISYTVEVSDDLGGWQRGAEVMVMREVGSAVDNGDGSETVRVRLTAPFGNDERWFVRLRVLLE